MTRDVPSPIVAYRTHASRPYRRPLDAYYAIAKELVNAKYPPSIYRDDDWVYPAEWSYALAERRHAKAARLFLRELPYGELGHIEFDENAWKRFIRRVAKFLRFRDSKRGIAAELEELTPKQLHDEFSYAERQADEWMKRAAAIAEYMRRT